MRIHLSNLSHRRPTYLRTDRYFIDRKKVNPDLFVIEIEICTCIYNIVNLLKSYDNIHSMTYITKIMLTGINVLLINPFFHAELIVECV